jgi:HTH-type transcriptional regulator, competence development regulator
MATQFGERIRELRTKQNMLLRQLAAKLDVDTSIISKVERGDRQMRKDQIPLLAVILNADKTELETLWLTDQIIDVIKDDENALKAIMLAEDEVKYQKTFKK